MEGTLQFSTHIAAPVCGQNITWFSDFFKITTTMKLKMTYIFMVRQHLSVNTEGAQWSISNLLKPIKK